jgi:hypothetical protein
LSEARPERSWDYDKLKLIFPFNRHLLPKWKIGSNKFTIKFFGGVAATITILILIIVFAYDMKPRNTTKECLEQCEDSKDPRAYYDFCNYIHKQGNSLIAVWLNTGRI